MRKQFLHGARILSASLLMSANLVPLWAETNDRTIGQFVHTGWSVKDGAPGSVWDLAQTTDGFLWLATTFGLYRFDGVTFERYEPQSGPPFPAASVRSLLALPNGDLWIGFFSTGVSRLRGGRNTNYSDSGGLPSGPVLKMAQDRDGAIWAAATGGVARFENDRWQRIGDNWGYPGGAANAVYVDRHGTVWIVVEERTVLFLPPGAKKFQTTGIAIGQAAQIAESPGGKLWMAETSRSVHPVRSLKPEIKVGSNSILFDDDASLWITTLGDGMRRVRYPDQLNNESIGQFSAATESFTAKDGLTSDYVTAILKDREGNIWVGTSRGLDRFRKGALVPKSTLPPPIVIRSITANGTRYASPDRLLLPPHTRDLTIDYTALSLAIPERVHFRYMLEGSDTQWQEAGTRRRAFYTNLAPREYRFRVTGSNNDGVWNETGASWAFSIGSTFYETVWFKTTMALAGIGLIGLLYRLRLQHITARADLRYAERLEERTRIARELHDTLLQSFQGSLFEVQAARNLFPRRPDDAMQTLDEAIRSADAAISEGRDAILDLRSGSLSRSDLACLFAAAWRELSGGAVSNGDSPAFRVTVEGPPRDVKTVLQDEVYRIGQEILRNAFRHARAEKIEVEIRYNQQELRIRFRDDGVGIDPKVLNEGARAGHWGLPGVRERATLAGAQLDFWSEVGAGTEVQVTVPASVAYAKSSEARVFGLFRKRTTSHGE